MPPSDQHPYCYPGTDIYRNKLDLRDAAALDQHERLISQAQIEALPRDVPLTPDGLKTLHRHLLEPVYDWAGDYRDVNTGRGAPFCKADYIAAETEKRFALLHGENDLKGLTPEQFAARAAEHLNELNAIHPFLDGNGRTNRALLELLGERAGHDIDLARIDPKAWNDASIAGFYRQDHEPMRQVIAATITEREPVPAQEPGWREQLEARRAELFGRDSTAGRDEPDHETDHDHER